MPADRTAESENHHFADAAAMINSGQKYQWILKLMGETRKRNKFYMVLNHLPMNYTHYGGRKGNFTTEEAGRPSGSDQEPPPPARAQIDTERARRDGMGTEHPFCDVPAPVHNLGLNVGKSR